MFAIELDVDAVNDAFARLRSSLRIAGWDAIAAASKASLSRISGGAYFKNRTGKTAKSFSIERSGEWQGAIVSRSPVAAFMDRGTKPHPIVARRARALRFTIDGRTIFARSVRHPGTKARNIAETEAGLLPAELHAALTQQVTGAVSSL